LHVSGGLQAARRRPRHGQDENSRRADPDARLYGGELVKLQHELHTLTGSYAVDALPPDELDEYERHLTHCGACAAEVRGLRETAARLGLAAAERPPAPMRDRVMGAA